MNHPMYPTIQPIPSTHRHIFMVHCDPNETEEPEEPVGPLDGKFEYKKNKNWTINKPGVLLYTLQEDGLRFRIRWKGAAWQSHKQVWSGGLFIQEPKTS